MGRCDDELTDGERLMVARERCGLSRRAVARLVLQPGKNKEPRDATIGAWERGKIGLTRESMKRMADLYETNPDFHQTFGSPEAAQFAANALRIHVQHPA